MDYLCFAWCLSAAGRYCPLLVLSEQEVAEDHAARLFRQGVERYQPLVQRFYRWESPSQANMVLAYNIEDLELLLL